MRDGTHFRAWFWCDTDPMKVSLFPELKTDGPSSRLEAPALGRACAGAQRRLFEFVRSGSGAYAGCAACGAGAGRGRRRRPTVGEVILETWAPQLEFAPRPELILGESNLLPFSFLRLGDQIGRAVVKIERGDGAAGTGFLVAPRIVLTNHHVLPNPTTAAAARRMPTTSRSRPPTRPAGRRSRRWTPRRCSSPTPSSISPSAASRPAWTTSVWSPWNAAA